MSNVEKHEDNCTLLRNPEDRDILTRKLFNVNMRMFRASRRYREIVQMICDHLRWCATTEREGYKKPHGYSGANAGIPFNIIALASGIVMINPTIDSAIGRRESFSNCGSLLLEKPIKISRFASVIVSYFDKTGEKHIVSGYLPTVQHEIDHNKGILITDREVKETPTLVLRSFNHVPVKA